MAKQQQQQQIKRSNGLQASPLLPGRPMEQWHTFHWQAFSSPSQILLPDQDHVSQASSIRIIKNRKEWNVGRR